MAKVRIIYKSGVVQDVKCSSFKVEFSKFGNELTSVTWVGAKPKPLYAGLGNIAAIYEL